MQLLLVGLAEFASEALVDPGADLGTDFGLVCCFFLVGSLITEPLDHLP